MGISILKNKEPVSDKKATSAKAVMVAGKDLADKKGKIQDQGDENDHQHKKIKKSRKKFKLKLKLNRKNCFIMFLLLSFIISLIIILLFIYAKPKVSAVLNRIVNPQVSVPETSDIDLTDVYARIDLYLSEDREDNLIISEEEFNSIIRDRYMTDAEFDMRVNFEKGRATFYTRFSAWMPWIITSLKNDVEGIVFTEYIKMGGNDLSSFFKENISEVIGDLEADADDEMYSRNLFTSIIFPNENQEVVIDEIYFGISEIEIVLLDNLESSDDAIPVDN